MTELMQEEVVFNYLNGAGNHEAKNLLASLVLANPERTFKSSQAANDMNARQSGSVEWEMRSIDIAQYFDRSLEPIGAVVRRQVIGRAGKIVDAWQASTEDVEVKLALSGATSVWGLRWPDVSVQPLLGATASPTEARAPQVRMQIYKALLTSKADVSANELVISTFGSEYAHATGAHETLRTLGKVGILAYHSKKQGYNPIVRIENAKYASNGLKLEHTTPETQALFKALQRLGEGMEIAINDLVDVAQSIDPSINANKLRRNLGPVGNPDSLVRHFPGLNLIDAKGIQSRETTRVSLGEDVRKPIEDLVATIEDVSVGRNPGVHIDRAKKILANSDEFGMLMAKARRFSPQVRGQQEKAVIDAQLLGIVRTLGQVSILEVRQALIDDFGRELGPARIRARLDLLRKRGLVGKTEQPIDRHMKRPIAHYYPQELGSTDY
jgi:hypothetical protein